MAIDVVYRGVPLRIPREEESDKKSDKEPLHPLQVILMSVYGPKRWAENAAERIGGELRGGKAYASERIYQFYTSDPPLIEHLELICAHGESREREMLAALEAGPRDEAWRWWFSTLKSCLEALRRAIDNYHERHPSPAADIWFAERDRRISERERPPALPRLGPAGCGTTMDFQMVKTLAKMSGRR